MKIKSGFCILALKSKRKEKYIPTSEGDGDGDGCLLKVGGGSDRWALKRIKYEIRLGEPNRPMSTGPCPQAQRR